MSARSNSTVTTGWLAWAVYLGVSWTWCIGMFLPVLLMRDFGNIGWWIFAVPNIVGAAAMGWILRSRGESEQIVIRHQLACETFSAVTIAFHVFFVAAVVPLMLHQNGLPLLTFGVISIVMFVMMLLLPTADRWLAAGVWIVSLAMAALCLRSGENGGENIAVRVHSQPLDLLGLTLVCLLGFLTCPYLDLTFHRARQRSVGPRRSFGVGFGVVFGAMIVFTYFYGHFAPTALPPLLIVGLGTHLVLQSGFTVAAHARELRHSRIAWVIAVLMIAVSILLVTAAPQVRLPGELPLWELSYRTFMGFYGLIFPAYVWLVMLPKSAWDKRWLVFLVAVVAAAPAYALGFLGRDYRWLCAGVGLVVLARVFLISPRRSFGSVQQNSAPI